jgi:formylglycine-generating enzyme required for sulfatase activity
VHQENRLLVLLVPVILVLAACAHIGTQPEIPASDSMIAIPAGVYRSLYRSSELNPQGPLDDAPVGLPPGQEPVGSFHLVAYQATNADYLAFVREQTRWRRSQVVRLFADSQYLATWKEDLAPGPQAPAHSPVVHVSWFAAKAYCQWQGKQLPTTAQWELAAAASETDPDGTRDPGFTRRILDWYGRPAPEVPTDVGSVYRNLWGVHDLHGSIWEWTLDFNTALVSGESRGDSGLERNLFCGAASIGAADTSDYAAFMRYAFRSSLQADYTVSSLGFRCARAGANVR